MGMRSPALSVPLKGANRPYAEGAKSRTTLQTALNRLSNFRDLRAINPEYLRRCARCSLKGLCEQCPAKSWSEHGTLDTPVEYLCEVAHAQARHLGWLGEKERGWEAKDRREGTIRSSMRSLSLHST
jgi:radical SAM protein with 4Fe4S-binding SPASM domain